MIEIYNPSNTDIERLKPKADMLKVSGDGVFATLQGEGTTSGMPSVFLRLHYCNLTCGKPEGWKCDTWYTWDKERTEYWTEPSDMGSKEAAIAMEVAWEEAFGKDKTKRAVITGGEPLLQQGKIIRLLEELPGWVVEIETNGTILPRPELSGCQINCSPKLENSGNTKARRYNSGALKAINELPNSWFKFVVSDNDDLEEIEQIVKDCELDERKLLIMPEGQTVGQVDKHAQIVRDVVEKKGWKITLRNQLIWYGNERAT